MPMENDLSHDPAYITIAMRQYHKAHFMMLVIKHLLGHFRALQY